MSRALGLFLTLAIGLVSPAFAQSATGNLAEGTPVKVVGVISSQPRDVGVAHEGKMQVAVGPEETDYTLHLNNANLTGYHGDKIGISDLRDKMWVYAEGRVMDDPRRIEVTNLQVIGGNATGYQQSRYYAQGFEQGYVMPTQAPAPAAAARFNEGTSVVVVGRVSSPPSGELNEQKMQVAIGPDETDYTLHFSDAELIGLQGQEIDEDGFNDGQWVRAVGIVMDDPRRINVTRVQVIAPDNAALPSTAFYRPGLAQGYVMAVAGERQTFPSTTNARVERVPMVLVGKVSDDTGALELTRKLQVDAAGNEWTLDVDDDATVIDERGERISVHSIDDGQWVRATGWPTDDLRMRVIRIENIGPDEAFQASNAFREGAPMGYVERVAGERFELVPSTMSGTVTAVFPDRNLFMFRDQDGNTHRVYTDMATFSMGGRTITLNGLRVGDRVTVQGQMVQMPE